MTDQPPDPSPPKPAANVVAAVRARLLAVQLGIGNSRMKDFFDLWHLARTYEFDGAQLTDAVRATFARRATAVPADPPVALAEEILTDRAELAQWAAFLRALKRSEPSWEDVIRFLRTFLLPLLGAARGAQRVSVWPPGGPWAMRQAGESAR